MRASPRGISTSRALGSESVSNRERINWKRESPERSLSAGWRSRVMARPCLGLDRNLGRSGKHCVRGSYERGEDDERSIKAKTPDRELLDPIWHSEQGDGASAAGQRSQESPANRPVEIPYAGFPVPMLLTGRIRPGSGSGGRREPPRPLAPKELLIR